MVFNDFLIYLPRINFYNFTIWIRFFLRLKIGAATTFEMKNCFHKKRKSSFFIIFSSFFLFKHFLTDFKEKSEINTSSSVMRSTKIIVSKKKQVLKLQKRYLEILKSVFLSTVLFFIFYSFFICSSYVLVMR